MNRGVLERGTFVAEQEVMINGTPPVGIQMRRPDIAYFSKEQIKRSRNSENVIPEFVIEIISNNDQVNQLEKLLVKSAYI